MSGIFTDLISIFSTDFCDIKIDGKRDAIDLFFDIVRGKRGCAYLGLQRIKGDVFPDNELIDALNDFAKILHKRNIILSKIVLDKRDCGSGYCKECGKLK